jgi:hypothetical protein
MSTSAEKPDNKKLVTIICLLVSVILIVGWPISMIISWSSIIDDPARVGYVIGDLGLVSPLFVASWLGLKNSKPWGSPLFLVAAGALSYDILHFGVYLICIKFLAIPTIVYILLIAAILGLLFYLIRQRIIYLVSIIGS